MRRRMFFLGVEALEYRYALDAAGISVSNEDLMVTEEGPVTGPLPGVGGAPIGIPVMNPPGSILPDTEPLDRVPVTDLDLIPGFPREGFPELPVVDIPPPLPIILPPDNNPTVVINVA